MKKILLYLTLFLAGHVGYAQFVDFQVRVDSLYSQAVTFNLGTGQWDGVTNHTWKLQSRIGANGQIITHNECFGIDSRLSSVWFSSGLYNYNADTDCSDINAPCRLIRNTVTSIGSEFRFIFQAYDHDEFGRCSEADDQICGWSEWGHRNEMIDFNNFVPGGWNRRVYEFCPNGQYRISLSYYVEPPPVDINEVSVYVTRGQNELNYCLGDELSLEVTSTDPGVIAHPDIQYDWYYNLDNESTSTGQYTCNQFVVIGSDPNCGEVPSPGSACWEGYDMNCYMCVDCQEVTNEIWHYATTSPSNSKTAKFSPPVTGSYKFRVVMRNNKTGRSGNTSLASASYTVYGARPTFPALAPTSGAPITLASQASETNAFMTVDHVKCWDKSTAKISILGITGAGRYYYNLKNNTTGQVMNVNGDGLGAPSAANPVVFPDEAIDPFDMKAGTYTLRIENIESPGDVNQRLCFSETSIVIRQPSTSVTASYQEVSWGNGNPYAISCNGQSDGKIDVTASGGVGPYDYTLGTTETNAGTQRFTGLSSQAYTIAVKDDLDCPATNVVTAPISQPAALTIDDPGYTTFGPNDEYTISCHDSEGSVDITVQRDAALPVTVSIPGKTTATIDEAGEAAVFSLRDGSYVATATYAHGCPATKNVLMKQPAQLGASVVTWNSPSCLVDKGENDDDGHLEFSITGGIKMDDEDYISYFSTAPTRTESGTTPMFDNIPAGTFELVIVDKYCTLAVDNEFVLPPPTTYVRFTGPAVVTEPSCNTYADGKIQVTGEQGIPFTSGNGGYIFYIDGISDGEYSTSTTFASGISRGTYTLRIEDSKTCFEEMTVDVGEPAPLGAFFSLTPNICRGDSLAEIAASLSGGTAPYTVQWKNIQNTTLLAEETSGVTKVGKLPRGNYTLLITDAHHCTNGEDEWYTRQQTVTDPDTLKVRPFYVENISCYGVNDGEVSLAASGGTGSYRYSVDSVTFITAYDFVNLPPGLNKFFVRDAGGCVRSTTQFIDEPEPLVVSLLPNGLKDAQCFGMSDGSAKFMVTGGTGPYYISKAVGDPWDRATQLAGLSAGTYNVQIKDENACLQEMEIIIGQPDLLTLEQPLPSINSTCSVANGQATVVAGGGVAPYSFSWRNSAGEEVNTTTSSTTLFSDVYRVSVTDTKQCVTLLDVEVSDEGGPNIADADITIPSCSYAADGAIDVTFTAGGALPYTITWDTQATTEDITGLSENSYRIAVEDNNGCKLFRSFFVDAPAPLDIVPSEIKDPTCFEYTDGVIDVVLTGGNGGYTFDGSSGITTKRITDLRAGAYTYVLTDSKNCRYEETITLNNPLKLVLGLEDRTICKGQVHTIDLPVANGTYQWSSSNGFISNQRSVSISAVGVYSVRVVDEKGCIAEEQFELNTSADLLKADFLVLKEAHVGDTLVAIDISWPIPDAVTWQYDPLTSKVIYQGQDYTEFIFDQPGTYSFGMQASLGECFDTYTQTITIIDGADEQDEESGRKKSSIITKFEIFPNPNDGRFSVSITLSQAVNGRLRMINLTGNKSLIDHTLKDATEFHYDVDLGNMTSGVYFLVLEAGEQAIKRVIIE